MTKQILMTLCLMTTPWLAQTHTPANEVTNYLKLRDFVMEAKEHLEKDPDRALRDFETNPDWINENTYIFVISMDGTMIFHPILKDSIGTNVLNTVDSNGFRIVEEMISVAKPGGGYLSYYWDNPAVQGDEEHGSFKLSYVQPVFESEALIGAGIHE